MVRKYTGTLTYLSTDIVNYTQKHLINLRPTSNEIENFRLSRPWSKYRSFQNEIKYTHYTQSKKFQIQLHQYLLKNAFNGTDECENDLLIPF